MSIFEQILAWTGTIALVIGVLAMLTLIVFGTVMFIKTMMKSEDRE